MTLFFRILILVSSCLMGITLYALTVNLLIYADLIPDNTAAQSFGLVLTQKATFVWIGASLLGIVALFVKRKPLHWVLILTPFLVPSLFSILYVLFQ